MSSQSAPRPSTAVTFRGGAGPVVEPIRVAPPGRGQVRVDIRATGVCHSDLHIVNGDRPADKPLVLGHEAAGVITETGPEVDGVSVGDPTLIDALRRAHQRSAESLRPYFLSHTQTSPTRYRKTFGTGR